MLIAGLSAVDGQVVHIRDDAPTTIAKVAPGEGDTKGRVVARLARLGVVDLQNDVVVPGAFGRPRDVVLSSWNHGSYDRGRDALPVGVGTVAEEGDYAMFRGRLLLDTSAGADVHSVLKALGGKCEWSWGFHVLESHAGRSAGKVVRYLDSVEVHEASPVLRGASIGSGTVQVSSVDPLRFEVERSYRDATDGLRHRGPTVSRIDLLLAEARSLGVDVPSGMTAAGATRGWK